MLPEGGHLEDHHIENFANKLKGRLDGAKSVKRVDRDEEARDKWIERYPELSEGQPGLLGGITSRAEAQVTRLSLIYALLANHSKITLVDLQAALALWDYCERSARFIFGETVVESPEEQRYRKLVEVVAGRPDRTVGLHWLTKSSLQCYRGKRDLAEHDMVELERRGLGLLLDPASGNASGRLLRLKPEAPEVDLDPSAANLAPKTDHTGPGPAPSLSETNGDRSELEATSNFLADAQP
jgi:hypothetical protein